MTLIAQKTVQGSIGATAGLLAQDFVQDKANNGVSPIPKYTHAEITNKHASQTLYIKRVGTATATDNDYAISAGQSAIIMLPQTNAASVLGSGAATLYEARYGNLK